MIEIVKEMIGKTMTRATGAVDADTLEFEEAEGTLFRFDHSQNCCEHVRIVDIVGDLTDLVGSPIVEAEEVSSDGHPAPENPDSYTWTFYRFSTVKGTVTVRWLGESNGYYGEGVDFTIFPPNGAEPRRGYYWD